MSVNVPDEKKKDTKGVSVYLPKKHFDNIQSIVQREGYMNTSDFLRDASRRLVIFYETKYYSRVLNILLENGKIKPRDLHEAFNAILMKDST